MKKKDNKLKLDLDLNTKVECLTLLKIRLAFLHDLNLFNSEKIIKIELFKKKTYGAVIYLNKDISMEMIFYLQLLLGSDYKKESCSLVNYYKFNMEYSNRLFLLKKYPNGNIITAKIYDVTKQIKFYVLNNNRKKQNF